MLSVEKNLFDNDSRPSVLFVRRQSEMIRDEIKPQIRKDWISPSVLFFSSLHSDSLIYFTNKSFPLQLKVFRTKNCRRCITKIWFV